MRRPPITYRPKPGAVAGVVLALAAAAVVLVLAHHDDTPKPVHFRPPAAVATAVPVPPVTAEQLRRLPASTTDTTITTAPLDEHRTRAGTRMVVNNRRAVPVFTAPGATAFARLPTRQIGSATWLPVIAGQPGWVRVLLPSRPNSSTGWLSATDLRFARTDHDLRVDLSAGRLHLTHRGAPAGTWPISAGTSGTPTPTGRTFVLALITDPNQRFSPLILPLGAHSTTLDTYAGGPGTVGIHGWSRTAVTGRPASHGCIRVPTAALRALRHVPAGTLVRIDAP